MGTVADSSGIGTTARGIRRVARATPPQLPMYRLSAEERRDLHALVEHEWLVTNGIGGGSTSTPAGRGARRLQGLPVPALPTPPGRTPAVYTRLRSAGGA